MSLESYIFTWSTLKDSILFDWLQIITLSFLLSYDMIYRWVWHLMLQSNHASWVALKHSSFGHTSSSMSQLTWPTTTRIKSSLRVEGVISLLPAIVWVCVAVNDSLSRYCLTARHRNLKLNSQDAVCWIWCWNAWTREVFLGIKARSICVDSAPGVGNAWAACLAYGTCRAARTRGKAGKTGWWRLVWDHAALSVWHDPYIILLVRLALLRVRLWFALAKRSSLPSSLPNLLPASFLHDTCRIMSSMALLNHSVQGVWAALSCTAIACLKKVALLRERHLIGPIGPIVQVFDKFMAGAKHGLHFLWDQCDWELDPLSVSKSI